MNKKIRFISLIFFLFLLTSCDQFITDDNYIGIQNSTTLKPITIVPLNEFETYYENMPKDSVTILDYGLNSPFNHILRIEIKYRGGCRYHTFELLASYELYLSSPPQLAIYLGHNSFNDPCSTLIHGTIYFNLEPL